MAVQLSFFSLDFKENGTPAVSRSVRLLGILAALTSLAISASGCKVSSENTSQQKTLDNFAAGRTVRVNECKGSETVILSNDRIKFSGAQFSGADGEKSKETHRAAVRDYMSALPREIQQTFINFGGQVLITERAAELCARPFSETGSPQFVAQGREQLESCFIYAKDPSASGAQSQAIFTIVHKPDVKAIRHGGVRVFGFLYAQFFPRLQRSPAGSAIPYTFNNKLLSDDSGFRGYKSRIAASFLTDMVDKGTYDLANLAPLLGDGAAGVITENVRSGSADPLKNVTWRRKGESTLTLAEQDIRRDRFMDFVFAEAFDSMRCSSASVAVMKAEFPKTHREFVAVDQAIIMLSQKLAESVNPASASAGERSFSLAGGGSATGAGLSTNNLASLLNLLFPALAGASGTSGASGGPGVLGQGGDSLQAPQGVDLSQLQNMQGMFGNLFQDLQQGGCVGGTCNCDGGCAGGCCGNAAGGGCTTCSGGCVCG
jgi:hypothetical protein